MKVNLNLQQTFDIKAYQTNKKLKRPNPPTEEAIKRAQFVDKTYVWKQK